MAVQERLYTADDLWELSHRSEYADKRLELVEGVLVEMSPTGISHGVIVSKLDRLIGTFVEEHKLGSTTGAETGYRLKVNPEGRDTVRAPDVGFVASGRFPEEIPDGYALLAPDLAVEVVSPTDTASENHDKVQDYLRFGTRQVWVFYPNRRTAVVHTPEGARTIEADGTLDGGDVLPGFSVRLSEIYAVLD
jgi:Uma2 family endonuclease